MALKIARTALVLSRLTTGAFVASVVFVLTFYAATILWAASTHHLWR